MALGVITTGALLGCATTISNREPNEAAHYFGYVKIEKGKAGDKEVSAEKVFFIGAKVSNGVQVGVLTSRTLSIPLDCRNIIIVANHEQLKEAVNTISRLGLDKICVSEL